VTAVYADFAADLPSAGTIAFSSLEENEEVFRSYGINQEMKQLGNGEFSSALTARRYGETELFSDRYNVALSIYLEPPPDTIGFLFPRTASGHFLASGVELGNTKLLVTPQGCGADLVGPALFGSDCIVMPTRRFHELVERLCDNFDPMESLSIVSCDRPDLVNIPSAI
jgi:hypothetical protein